MDLNKAIPLYLLEKRNIIKLILLTATFALIFINAYQPFGSDNWLIPYKLPDYMYFVLSSVLVLFGMLVVTISRIIMYQLHKHRGYTPLLGYYFLWILGELFFMSVSFVLFEKIAFEDSRNVIELFKTSAVNTSLVLLLPYSVLWLYFSWSDKKKQLEQINNQRFDSSPSAKNQMINFFDNKGEVKFSVKLPDLVYIKGADNYIIVYYKNADKLSSMMIRYSMKQVEDELSDKGIVRCHRSYIVNSTLMKMFERTRDGIVIRLEAPGDVVIPVSKSYSQTVFELFEK